MPEKQLKEPMVRVIRDVRDGRIDYKLPSSRAKELFEQKMLQWDATNGSYCTSTIKLVE